MTTTVAGHLEHRLRQSETKLIPVVVAIVGSSSVVAALFRGVSPLLNPHTIFKDSEIQSWRTPLLQH